MSIDSTLLRKLAKLHALSQFGEEGEKENSTHLLKNLLALNGLTMDDLLSLSDKEDRIEVVWENEFEERLCHQVALKAGVDIYEYHVKRSQKAKRTLIIRARMSKIEEFKLYFDAYRAALKKHMNIAYRAFVQTNDIFPKEKSQSPKVASSEEDLQMLRMARGLDAVDVHKRIGKG